MMDYSSFTERISFVRDFNTLVMMPFLHRNTINFIGMGHKKDYLIWREEGGYFTALNKQGIIYTWSVATGKLLSQQVDGEKLFEWDDFEVYRADDNDSNYTKNFCNHEDGTI